MERTIESVEIDGVRVQYEIERSGPRCRGIFQLRGEQHETRWAGASRFVANDVTRLVGRLNIQAAAEAAERQRLAAWNAGLPKQVTPVQSQGPVDGQQKRNS